VHVVNRGIATATGVVLDSRADPSLRLVSTELGCSGGLPCTLGELAPGAVRTVIAHYAFAGSAPGRPRSSSESRAEPGARRP
jgi:hypothetical protein